MKLLLFFSVLITFTLCFTIIPSDTDPETCADSYAALLLQVQNLPQRLDVTPKVYSQKVFDCVRAVPGVLDDCDLPEAHEEFDHYLPKACINQLQDLTTLYDQYDRATNNITKTLYMTQLTARLATTFPLTCPNLYEVVKHFINHTSTLLVGQEITPVCGEAIYQYSLLIENLFRDVAKSNQKLAQDISAAFVELPNTLDTCGEKQLATTIRNDFPKECLSSITDFASVVEQFVYNHAHLEWIFTHIKKLASSFAQIKYTCPAF